MGFTANLKLISLLFIRMPFGIVVRLLLPLLMLFVGVSAVYFIHEFALDRNGKIVHTSGKSGVSICSATAITLHNKI